MAPDCDAEIFEATGAFRSDRGLALRHDVAACGERRGGDMSSDET
jgi:hypothetical protein